MAPQNHNVPIVARVVREYAAGEVIAVTLRLVHPDGAVEVEEGDEFVTGLLAVDPWAPT